MRLHPLLEDPEAVFVYREPVSSSPTWGEFQRVALAAAAAMHWELEGEKVVLKPNVTAGEHFADPDSGITTHPGFVEGLVEYLSEHGARRGGIYILEAPAGCDRKPCSWAKTGYLQVAARTKAKLRSPLLSSCVWKAIPNPLVHEKELVSRHVFLSGAVLVNVPKLKTHNMAITTLSMKNLMGTVYVHRRHYCGQAMEELGVDRETRRRPRHEWMDEAFHERWQEAWAKRIVDLAKIVRPKLNIIEGVVGRDGTGFNRGKNYPLGMVVAGINMVAVDAVASYLMGFDPAKIIYLRMAAEAGLGTHELAKIRVYTAQAGELIPCKDLEALRAPEPFRVFRGIRGEALTEPVR